MNIITAVYNFLWGDLITLPLPGGSSIGISLLVLLLVPAGIYFTIRTRFVLIRKFPHMIQIAMEKNEHSVCSLFIPSLEKDIVRAKG